VLAVEAEYCSAVERSLEQAEQGSGEPAQQREEPEAPPQVLARLEDEAPHGDRLHWTVPTGRRHHPVRMNAQIIRPG
jgi:hypothetical protein